MTGSEKSDNENEGVCSLKIVKINPRELSETLIDLNVQLRWVIRETPYSTTNVSHLVHFSSCPHGGVFVYINEINNIISNAKKKIIFINDLGVNTQDIWDQYRNCCYAGLTCGEEYIALTPHHADPSPADPLPILFVPYKIISNGTIQYKPESDTNKWPTLERKSYIPYTVTPLEDKFHIIEGDECYVGDIFIIDPKNIGSRLPPLSDDNSVINIEGMVFPKGYKPILSLNWGYIKENNLLFILGRKYPKSYDSSYRWEDINWDESPHQYGIIVIKNLKNSETIGWQFLCHNTQMQNLHEECVHLSGSYLFITTYYHHGAPRLRAINIQGIQRLFSEKKI